MLKKSLIILGIIISLLIVACEVKFLATYSASTTTTIVQEPIKPSYDYLKSTTVYIIGCSGEIDLSEKLTYNLDSGGTCWAGTGVIVKMDDNETYILTNNHVAGRDKDDVILFVENNGRKFPAEVVEYHSKVDAAIIKVNDKLVHKSAIKGIAEAEIQDPVYIVGNPLSVKFTYTEGVVANFEGIDILIQAPCIYGNSGSAVVNANGELVGLVYALEIYPGFMGIPTARITHTLAVDIRTIKGFLENLGLYNE
jgi:S1-C subfamily serine protease